MIDLIESRLQNERLFYDDNWITDGNIALKRDAADLEYFLKNAIPKYKNKITKLLNDKGVYITDFDLKQEYENAIYDIQFEGALLPIGINKKWYIDSRWFQKVYNFFYEMDNVKVYEFDTGDKIGPILEFIGWENSANYNAGQEPKILAYVLGVNRE